MQVIFYLRSVDWYLGMNPMRKVEHTTSKSLTHLAYFNRNPNPIITEGVSRYKEVKTHFLYPNAFELV